MLSPDIFLIVELPPQGSSQSKAYVTHTHTHTHIITTSHILRCDIPTAGEGDGDEEENTTYLPVWKLLGKCVSTVKVEHEHYDQNDIL